MDEDQAIPLQSVDGIDISSITRRCNELKTELELWGNLILTSTLANVAIILGLIVYTVYNKQTILSSYYYRDEFNSATGALLILSIIILGAAIASLLKFQRLSQSARIYVEEMSDSLSWLRNSQAKDKFVEFKIALRELAGRADLPLAAGRQGYLAYFSLNIVSVLLFGAFIVYVATAFAK